MNLSVAIVGLPNVGKSTLFNALLKRQVALVANYPFATIEPNVGIVEVPDERLPKLAEIVRTNVIKPATVEFVDIAGLVKGASQGEGLGNQFLANIRETQAVCHVLRAFVDPDIIREGATDPMSDLETIRTELQLADLATLSKQVPPKGAQDKSAQERWSALELFKTTLEKGESLNTLPQLIDGAMNSGAGLNSESVYVRAATELCLLTAKSELFAINVDENSLSQAPALQKEWAEKLRVEPDQIVIISAKIENELSTLSTEDQQMYLQELGISQSGLERLSAAAYRVLHLQSFLTGGEMEVRAWTIRQGTTARDAAGTIHTDFVKHFIQAKIVSYPDFIALNGWKGAKEVGKIRMEGATYVMQPDDVVEFMIGK